LLPDERWTAGESEVGAGQFSVSGLISAPIKVNDRGEFITVRGRLVDAFGHPLAAYRVSLSDYDLDGTTEIDSVGTNAGGAFQFVFRRNGPLRPGDDATSPDLLFQVFDQEQVERTVTSILMTRDEADTDVPRLAESEVAPIVLMNVAADVSVRITVSANRRAPTEFEQLVAWLSPFMGRTEFADLAEDEKHFQISFLARETGASRAKIEQLRDAFRQERIARGVPAWAFFGLASEGSGLARLAHLPEEELVRILAPLQPERDGADLGEVARCLLEFLRERDFENKAGALREAVGGWMMPLLGSDEKTSAFLQAYVRHDGEIDAFWRKMEEHPDFAEAVPGLQLNAQLAQVTLSNTGLVDALRERGIENTRQLVDLPPETWETLAYEHRAGIPAHIAGEDDTARAKIYAREMQTVVELAFPTPFIRKTIQDPATAAFLDRNPDFDFTRTPVEGYLRDRGEAALEGIEKPDEVKARLRRTQRLYAVTANAADAQTLMDLNFDSAHGIARLSLDDFARRVEGRITPEKVYPYHAKAVSVTEASAMSYHWLRDLSHSPTPAAAGNPSGDPQVRDALPDWQSLFGPLALCGCEHCRSVYSPAAYFVDLLHILLGQNEGAARKELFRRRPDLLYTKLSCEHTETLIPYIDLVNEVLETYVAQSHVGDADAHSHAEIGTKRHLGLQFIRPARQSPASQPDLRQGRGGCLRPACQGKVPAHPALRHEPGNGAPVSAGTGEQPLRRDGDLRRPEVACRAGGAAGDLRGGIRGPDP
jgi:hypothetical protein